MALETTIMEADRAAIVNGLIRKFYDDMVAAGLSESEQLSAVTSLAGFDMLRRDMPPPIFFLAILEYILANLKAAGASPALIARAEEQLKIVRREAERLLRQSQPDPANPYPRTEEFIGDFKEPELAKSIFLATRGLPDGVDPENETVREILAKAREHARKLFGKVIAESIH